MKQAPQSACAGVSPPWGMGAEKIGLLSMVRFLTARSGARVRSPNVPDNNRCGDPKAQSRTARMNDDADGLQITVLAERNPLGPSVAMRRPADDVMPISRGKGGGFRVDPPI